MIKFVTKIPNFIYREKTLVMTSFTERCIGTLHEKMASLHLPPVKFVLAQGKYEEYQYAKVSQKDLLVELYVFVDEAGCALNERNWKIFEKWDFSDDSDLIRAFVAYVINVLTSPGIKEEHQGRFWSLIKPEVAL